ncbi:MAG: peptidoglycan DD-metalloendopeptidase family protein [Chitinophagaceae bacterium]
MVKKLVSCILVMLLVCTLQAQQTSKQLKQQQAAIQQEITELKGMVSAAQKQKRSGLGQLAMLQRKLQLRQQAIDNINQQLDAMDNEIGQSEKDVVLLKKQLTVLKEEYRVSVVQSYKSRNNFDFLSFIFSASDFSNALKRLEYLRAYRLHRQQQANTIVQTQQTLQQKITGLQTARVLKRDVLDGQVRERVLLTEERKEQAVLVANLASRETELLRELAAKQKADLLLRSAILKAINKDGQKVIRPVVINNAKVEKNAPVVRATPARKPLVEDRTASALFETKRGKLPWPAGNAVVTQGFGVYHVPGQKGITGFNYGITLAMEKGASVKAVADGVVYSVFDVDGDIAVMIQHGNYYTVYGHLQQATVTEGTTITTGQAIGSAASKDDKSEVEFMILQGKVNVNPEQWLMKR